MKYAKIVNGIVEQIQPNEGAGFIQVPEDTVCGMLDIGGGAFSNPTLTPAQIAENSFFAKWKQVDDYMATLEVTSDVSVGGNKFNVSPQGIINIQNAMRGMIGTDTKRWVESWDTFNTNLVEMEWVLKEAERLRDAKIVEVGL